ncbi:MAG TPA: hypothetical protein VMW50_03665 [Dehalococcoidia bacterium]|nr:hypothetical protein [Dehalococcoidia bacterium]
MIVKLPVTQITPFWELIKFAISKVYEVKTEDFRSIFNHTLHKLLNDKAQCWVRLNDKRMLVALMITEIQVDKINGNKQLFVPVLYSWRPTGNDEWKEDFEFITKFAKKENCKYITCESDIARCWELYELCGFKEILRKYSLKVGD